MALKRARINFCISLAGGWLLVVIGGGIFGVGLWQEVLACVEVCVALICRNVGLMKGNELLTEATDVD